jgi:tetratricopeptide (TPR) repeat protein
LPAGVKEVVASGKDIADSAMAMNTESAAYIRRMYLQDLYRFFKLHPERKDFANPFEYKDDDVAAFFVANELFDGLLGEELVVVERHLFKSKKYDVVVKLVSRLIAKGVASADEKYICALACQRLGRNEDAYKLLLSLQDCKYDITRVQKSLADVLFALGHYVDAAKYYKMCLEREPENRRLVLCHSLALVNSGNVKDGLVDLFRLDYENDNDVDVKRIIAWGYLVNCKPNDSGEKLIIKFDQGVGYWKLNESGSKYPMVKFNFGSDLQYQLGTLQSLEGSLLVKNSEDWSTDITYLQG